MSRLSGLEFDVEIDDLTDSEEEGCSAEEIEEIRTGDAILPHCGMEDSEVETLNVPYSTRAAEDWVSSGPLGPEAIGQRGRYFETWEAAEVWARRQFGLRLKGRVVEAQVGNRWAFLIAGPRGVAK